MTSRNEMMEGGRESCKFKFLLSHSCPIVRMFHYKWSTLPSYSPKGFPYHFYSCRHHLKEAQIGLPDFSRCSLTKRGYFIFNTLFSLFYIALYFSSFLKRIKIHFSQSQTSTHYLLKYLFADCHFISFI